MRVVGTDPGTSSLDLLLLIDGQVADQARFTSEQLRNDPELLRQTLQNWQPLRLVAGPSGYGLPLVNARDLTGPDLDAMSLVRPDERGRDLGVQGFKSWVRACVASGAELVFLPGGIHLPTIPAHRKANAIDMGTPDKLAVAALALRHHAELRNAALDTATFAVVEIGSAFTSVIVLQNGRIVDAASGSRGPLGLLSSGAWDGEVAYLLSPLSKADLFRGGVSDLGDEGLPAFRESLVRGVAGLKAVTSFDWLWLSGAGLQRPEIAGLAEEALAPFGTVRRLPSLPGAWVKHAAQGAALLADGLAGGRHADLVEALELRAASGTIGDTIRIRPNEPGLES